ncbi:DNA repair protein RAD50 isoform X2 [Anthonomus grandis grandis]|nr:DNA repair protein RAD50 isoform X2 [Anthonomus grandis grandis]
MSVLDKLVIRGIRSFGPDNEEKVNFSTPLTLFLGQNGCGKTTIIECLKYALTSDLPGGSDNGRGFINDPKLSDRATTKSCIKLRFKDAKGDFVTVAKFIQLSTERTGKLKFQSLAPTLRWEAADKSKAEDISGRCIDIDVYCAQKLNVSKAILNSVIFCHQEDSAWPLDEGKKLKEKFDVIFGAEKYNKCVERFRKLIKAKRDNIKLLKEQLELKKLARKNTDEKKETLQKNEERLAKIEGEMEEKQNELDPLQTRLKEINEVLESLSMWLQKLAGLETTYKGVLEQQASLKKHLETEFPGTDEELEAEISNFDNFQALAKKDMAEKEHKKETVESKIMQLNQNVQKRQVAFGQLKEEEFQHQKRGEELKTIILKAKMRLEVDAEDDEPVPDILYKLNQAFKKCEEAFNDKRKGFESDEKVLQSSIDDIRAKLAAIKESVSSKKKTIDESKSKMAEAERKLNRLSQVYSQVDIIEKRMKDLQETLGTYEAEFQEAEVQENLEALDSLITQKENSQTKLEREYRLLQQNYLTEQKIDAEKHTIIDKKLELDNLKNKWEDQFKELFGQEIPQDNFERAVKLIQKREEEQVKNLNKSVASCEKKITTLESNVRHSTEKLKSYNDELTKAKNKLESICKGKPFTEVLEETFAKKEKLQKDKGMYASCKLFYEQYINAFESEDPCCPICSTNFSAKQSMTAKIIDKLKNSIESLPMKLSTTEAQLAKVEDLYNKLQQLEPVNENIDILEGAKIPLLEEELNETKEKLEEATMELASLKNELAVPQKLVEACRAVVADASLIDRLNQELKKSENVLQSLQRDLVTVSSNRTLHQVETELAKVKKEIGDLRREYKAKRDQFDETKEKIRSIGQKLQREIEKKLQHEKQVQEQPLLERQIKEYKENIAQLQKEVVTGNDTISNLSNDLKQAEKRKEDACQNNKKVLDEKRTDLDLRRRLIDEVAKLHKVVKHYEEGDSKTKLQTILNELEECKTNIKKLEDAKKVLVSAIVKKKEELASQESKLRSLNDNKELRQNRKKSQELEIAIKSLKKQIGNHNNSSIIEERKTVMKKLDFIQNDISRKVGEQDTIKGLIRSLKAELNRKEHKEVISEYKKKYYELRLEILSADDLEVYTISLEKAIIKFHQERMVQVNMIIRDLWRNIYRGNDIDHIEIRTDDCGTTARNRRTYNYKVVQMKKSVELEMRGRCSAGQKVLACLVIRMALAETFSTNCGILALDEPTTNLDRDNILSLSDALSRLISMREKQKSFQLLVITHDEEFLQTITRNQSVSHYFRVKRNADGFSTICREIL